jgi:hypothetical protein
MATIHDYPAGKARGAVIVFTKPWQKLVFMAGLFGAVLLLLIATLVPIAH